MKEDINLCIKDSLVRIFPKKIRDDISDILRQKNIEEIRVYIGKRLLFYSNGQLLNTNLNIIMTKELFNEMLEYITDFSLYAIKDELKNGYITIDGGHRIGIAGKIVTQNGKIENIFNISSLNIRLAKPIYEISKNIYPYTLNRIKIYNILIVAPPGVGKTTLLRDIIRNASKTYYKKITIIDERGEIAAMHNAMPLYDIGDTVDVLDMCKKESGYLLAIRTLSPDIIAVDEICEDEDYLHIQKCFNSGIHIWATIHGSSFEDLLDKPYIQKFIENDNFNHIFVIDKYTRHITIYDSDGGVLNKC